MSLKACFLNIVNLEILVKGDYLTKYNKKAKIKSRKIFPRKVKKPSSVNKLFPLIIIPLFWLETFTWLTGAWFKSFVVVVNFSECFELIYFSRERQDGFLPMSLSLFARQQRWTIDLFFSAAAASPSLPFSYCLPWWSLKVKLKKKTLTI